MDVPRPEARRILGGLGFEELRAGDDGATWRVPSWRQDVAIEEDLVEELVRTVGYDAIPETLPRLGEVRAAPTEEEVAVGRIRGALEAAGFAEAVNFSFLAPEELAAFDPGARPVPLKNPISAELAVMRTSVLPSLLRNAAANLRQRVEDVRLYEIARAYGRDPGQGDAPADEWGEVAGVLVGRRSPPGWAAPRDGADLFDAKAAVQAVLGALGVAGVRFAVRAEPWSHPRASAAVLGERDALLGTAAELHPRVADAFGLPRGVLAFVLDLDALLAHARLVPRYRPIPRHPAVLRDLAVVVDASVQAGQVLGVVKGEPLVEEATLFVVYTGPPLPEGKKNLALALRYRAPDRTLTDAEVDAAHAGIVERLRDHPLIRAELRA
jgi:phenylalanyl-tRNA synthetase beta chain